MILNEGFTWWIGLNDRGVEGTFKWFGGAGTPAYTDWFPGKINIVILLLKGGICHFAVAYTTL